MRKRKSLILQTLVRGDLMGISNIAFGSDLSGAQAAGVSKHVGRNCGEEIARNRCHSLFSYAVSMDMNMSIDQRPGTRRRDWEPQSGQYRSM
jgi:hypothetical protein